jgi:hypothetical protein
LEPAYRDLDYDRIHDRFLVTRSATNTHEYRGIQLSLGWTSRLDDLIAARRDGKR